MYFIHKRSTCIEKGWTSIQALTVYLKFTILKKQAEFLCLAQITGANWVLVMKIMLTSQVALNVPMFNSIISSKKFKSY